MILNKEKVSVLIRRALLKDKPLSTFSKKELRRFYKGTFKVMRDADKHYEFISKLKGD